MLLRKKEKYGFAKEQIKKKNTTSDVVVILSKSDQIFL